MKHKARNNTLLSSLAILPRSWQNLLKIKISIQIFTQAFTQRYRRNIFPKIRKITVVLSFVFVFWLSVNVINIIAASSQPVGVFFVLGGSIRREIYVAQLAKKYPQIPVLISSGSKEPCIWLIFHREAVALDNIWLEKCASSTFGNFYHSIPVLQTWKVRKVRLITSPSHLPRARWMAQILFGARGIWVEIDAVRELGVPGNKENLLKTGLDVTRSLLWAIGGQFIQPKCSEIIKLADVNMQHWQQKGFKCENQGKVISN
ncbi:MAG: YdcF family protein [Calothrix sp. SM1_7_51]|nr:YdcF family protein [Calothrix sp. SM1_7_51]